MVSIYPVQTGVVRVKTAQVRRRRGGLVRVLLDTEWTDWLPILAWAIDHPEGTIVVDTGDTWKTSEKGYFPPWHPYYRSVKMDIAPEQEIGPQLRELGFDPDEVPTVILTHFHTDHAGGLHHFRHSDILVDAGDHARAKGITGRLQGYLPNRWPSWFRPSPISLAEEPYGPFPRSYRVTRSGDVVIVPTPGHTAGHVSVVVRSGEKNFFLAGDTSYTQDLLVAREPDGVSPRGGVALRTIDRILDLATREPVVYLPSHDPDSTRRLEAREVLSV